MTILVVLVAVAVLFLVVGLIVTAIKWLTILALLFVVLAVAQGYRARRH
jgi:hypothetical protein